MSKPIIITCQPDDQYFLWQNHLYIESCIEQGFEEEQIHILLYKPKGRPANTNWEKLKECYPKLNIFSYEDKGVQQFLGTYIPILRPHIMAQHFETFPELKEKTILYTDCDILWVGKLDIAKFFDDDINYISDAASYLNYDYLKRKENDVLPERKEEFSKIDVIQEMCDLVGISKEIVQKHNTNCGGVQYILKNLDADFWRKVEKDVLAIRLYLMAINRTYFKDENSGYQSWCADLWAVLWNLWARGKETKVVDEMNFAWSTDPIANLESHGILHNAGVTGPIMGTSLMFYKGKYMNGSDPTLDPHFEALLSNQECRAKCNWHYANKLKELKNKYNINY